ncbi:MAG: Uma2 family endonuclease, partial [Gemmatales bacterium]|nr:Uma2 family endonuclease [Gemmatales bacterium]
MNSAITIPAEPTTISSPPRSPESSLAHQVGVTQPQETGTSYPARKLTADEFLPLAERNEAAKLELIHGEVVPMSPVNLEHSRIQSRLVRTLGTFVENHQLGEVFVDPGVILGEGSETVRAPDVAYWSAARLSQAPSLKGFTR